MCARALAPINISCRNLMSFNSTVAVIRNDGDAKGCLRHATHLRACVRGYTKDPAQHTRHSYSIMRRQTNRISPFFSKERRRKNKTKFIFSLLSNLLIYFFRYISMVPLVCYASQPTKNTLLYIYVCIRFERCRSPQLIVDTKIHIQPER